MTTFSKSAGDCNFYAPSKEGYNYMERVNKRNELRSNMESIGDQTELERYPPISRPCADKI